MIVDKLSPVALDCSATAYSPLPWQLELLKDCLIRGRGRIWCGGVTNDDFLFSPPLGSPRSFMASPITTYEPSPRFSPFTASIVGKLYMWGGCTEDRSEHGKKRVQSVAEVFDPYIEVWSQQPTTGTQPLGLYAGACAAIAASMYICCG